MLNHIAVMGRLARDPELRRTSSGTAVTSFSLACERDIADKQSGTKAVDFIDCVAWGGTAEIADRYLSKGDMATVSGRLQIRQYTDKAGQKRRAAEIKVDSVLFLRHQRKQRTEPPKARRRVCSATGRGFRHAGRYRYPAPILSHAEQIRKPETDRFRDNL